MATFNNQLGDFDKTHSDKDQLSELGITSASDQSFSTDLVQAVGLNSLNVDVDAEATISATSTAKSTANATNVSSDSASLASVEFNSGLKGTNVIGSASNAGLSGTAGTTVNASAATSDGDALSYAQIKDSAGIQGVTDLTVGGELNALGKAVNTITSSSETVVGSAEAGSNLSNQQFGLEANRINVSSDASIQGLAQLTNSATASATSGTQALAEAFANNLTGADLDGLKVGGVASVAGQASFGNTSTATNVDGNAIAESDLATATGLTATINGVAGAPAGIDVSSDATITGLSAITSSATAATTDGKADADSNGGMIKGIDIVNAEIGGVASITGQSTFTGSANSSNVTGGGSSLASEADSTLRTADGLIATDKVGVSSDATLKGLSSINMSAMAESTGSLGDETTAHAGFAANNLSGAALEEVSIGGVGNLLGQVGFTGAGNASNVTGNADVLGELNSAKGLTTTALSDINSDGTLKGIASVTGSATAATTAGDADARAFADTINGADFGGLVDIGGIGSIQGAASFNLSAKSTNVTGDPATGTVSGGDFVPADSSSATAGNNALSAVGLQSINGVDSNNDPNDFGINVASDANLSGTAIGSLKAEAFSTATDATATLGADSKLTGANLEDLHVGGIASVTGAAQLTGNGTASSVGGVSQAQSGLGADVTGLTADLIDVASNATITAQAFGTLNATATSTGGNAFADAGSFETQLTGISNGLELNIGGIGTVSALAQGSENATATSVDGMAAATAGMDLLGVDHLKFDSSSDGNLTAMAKLVANVDASNIGGSAENPASASGHFSAIGFDGLEIGNVNVASGLVTGGTDGIGGITTLKGQAQITGTLNAESVSGEAHAGQTFVPASGNTSASWMDDAISQITGMTGVELNGASDGTIVGTASGVFNTSASSTLGDASGYSAQDLRGISTLDLNLGGNGGINAIVNDTNFVSAHSVSGNATAVASVDAIGLDGGNIHIAGNATILANVGVDSKAEAGTIG